MHNLKEENMQALTWCQYSLKPLPSISLNCQRPKVMQVALTYLVDAAGKWHPFRFCHACPEERKNILPTPTTMQQLSEA